MKTPPLLTYQDVLSQMQKQENHLLIGNGFNRGLGINTSYGAIFDKMIENSKGVYNDAKELVETAEWDLERFIGLLEEDVSDSNLFLKKYIHNKVKLDFMQATHEIVKSEIKNVYAEKNLGVFLLLQNFTTLFTLNYDPLLYLLLLQYKKVDPKSETTLAMNMTIPFIEEDLNDGHKNIYKKIKQARESGELEVTAEGNKSQTPGPATKSGTKS